MVHPGLVRKLVEALPPGWSPLPQATLLQSDGVHVVAVTGPSGGRAAFILVTHLQTSAKPLFLLNDQLRDRGFQTLALFTDQPIPSTARLPCAQVLILGRTVQAALVNATQQQGQHHFVQIEFNALVQACANSRLKLLTVRAKQWVQVEAKLGCRSCPCCGAFGLGIVEAQIGVSLDPAVPKLSLKLDQISRGVSALIKPLVARANHNTEGCRSCLILSDAARSDVMQAQSIEGMVALSSMAALELICYHRTVWVVDAVPEEQARLETQLSTNASSTFPRMRGK